MNYPDIKCPFCNKTINALFDYYTCFNYNSHSFYHKVSGTDKSIALAIFIKERRYDITNISGKPFMYNNFCDNSIEINQELNLDNIFSILEPYMLKCEKLKIFS